MASLAFDAFTKLAERLIDIENSKYKTREDLFNGVIQPLFTDFQPMVDNYFSLFRKARALAKKSPSSFQKAVDEIKNAREEMLHNRIQVREFADAIAELYEDDLIKQFAEKVYRFFYSTKGEIRGVTSGGKRLVDLFEYVIKDNVSQKELIVFIDDALIRMEKSWVEIAEAYAHLRIYCLNSKGLKLKIPVQASVVYSPINRKVTKGSSAQKLLPKTNVWVLIAFCLFASMSIVGLSIFTVSFLMVILGTSNMNWLGSQVIMYLLGIISFSIGSKKTMKSPSSFILITSLLVVFFPYLIQGLVVDIAANNIPVFGTFSFIMILFAVPFVFLGWYLAQLSIVFSKSYGYKVYVLIILSSIISGVLFQQLISYFGRLHTLLIFAFPLVVISLWGYLRDDNVLKPIS